MSLSAPAGTRTALLFTLFLSSLCVLLAFYISAHATAPAGDWSSFCVWALLAAGFLSASALLIFAVRATVLTWITVLVLLAFAGKRRRVLAQQGRKITADVVMYFVKGSAQLN